MTIKQGDLVTFKPEWSDPGDETITFRAIEDEDRGRVKVLAELGLPINPTQVASVEWIATVNGRLSWRLKRDKFPICFKNEIV